MKLFNQGANVKALTTIASGFIFSALAGTVLAADQGTVFNKSSIEKFIEARAGHSNDCNSNQIVWSAFVKGGASKVVPYGGGITALCARVKIDGGWSGWTKTGCPGDNSLCFINIF